MVCGTERKHRICERQKRIRGGAAARACDNHKVAPVAIAESASQWRAYGPCDRHHLLKSTRVFLESYAHRK